MVVVMVVVGWMDDDDGWWQVEGTGMDCTEPMNGVGGKVQ